MGNNYKKNTIIYNNQIRFDTLRVIDKDRTPLGLYSHKDHGTRKRMQNYFSRHSGTRSRNKAIKLERKKSKGYYNAKILSHEYLW